MPTVNAELPNWKDVSFKFKNRLPHSREEHTKIFSACSFSFPKAMG
jgi:hypothetical protein